MAYEIDLSIHVTASTHLNCAFGGVLAS